MRGSNLYTGPPIERFWEKVDTTSGSCWEWQAKKNNKGYGRFTVAMGNQVYAHRFAYEDIMGPIPSGLFVLHKGRLIHKEHEKYIPYKWQRVA